MADKVPTLLTEDLINLYESAGFNPCDVFDPKTVGMVKKNSNTKPCLKSQIKKTLRILDEQNAINRYKWYNLPSGIDGQLLEWVLYYKGQGMFFYSELDNKFYFLPYALNGTIDVYGRFRRVVAIQLGNNTVDGKDIPIEAFTRDVVYDVLDIDEDTFENGCVLLKDYYNQRSQTNIARQILQEPVLDAMAEAFPLARTALIANSGVKGMRVNDQTEQSNVISANESVTEAALTGKPWIPIIGSVEFQDLTDGSAMKSGEYLQYMQALDNYRLSLYGLKNGGIFEKDSAYVNTTTASNIQNNVGLVYQDGLTLRQKFCDIVNSIWGLGIWCEASETVTNTDTNMDGEIADNQDQSGTPSEQPVEEVQDE